MVNKIILSKQATQFLRKRPRDDVRRIMTRIERLTENPFQFLEHIEGERGFKLRVGSFRALCDIDKSNQIIRVRLIEKRSRVYDPKRR